VEGIQRGSGCRCPGGACHAALHARFPPTSLTPTPTHSTRCNQRCEKLCASRPMPSCPLPLHPLGSSSTREAADYMASVSAVFAWGGAAGAGQVGARAGGCSCPGGALGLAPSVIYPTAGFSQQELHLSRALYHRGGARAGGELRLHLQGRARRRYLCDHYVHWGPPYSAEVPIERSAHPHPANLTPTPPAPNPTLAPAPAPAPRDMIEHKMI
jgi:hypothetical protein